MPESLINDSSHLSSGLSTAMLGGTPALSFRFSVTFFFPEFFHIPIPDIMPWDMSFQKVSGIGAKISTHKLNEGGENSIVHRLPDRVEYDNLVLERGFLKLPTLPDYRVLNLFSVASMFRDAMEQFEIKPCDVLVVLHEKAGIPISAWRFRNAFPVQWKLSDLDANEESIVIEHMELAYQNMWSMRI
ncbi:MAG: phage tail protein [Proteobacteria bacterium]|nr:phage tail protein [Pseudomonadota bacterium]